MIPEHRKPKWVFTPAAPPQRRVAQEEGVPLHQIDRRLWPGMTVVRCHGPAKPQGRWADEVAGRVEERDSACVPAAGADLCVSASLRGNPSPSLTPTLNPNPAPSHVLDAVGDETARTDKDVYPTKRNVGGRPRALTPQKRTQLLHILRRGQSRRYAAEKIGINAATITRAIRRDPRLAIDVMGAEEEGQMFLEIWDRLYSLQETTLELKPVVSTPQLEREKEYLIACGLEPEYVRRLRVRTVNDPPPPEIPEEFKHANREMKIRPWKKGWRKKKAKKEADWW